MCLLCVCIVVYILYAFSVFVLYTCNVLESAYKCICVRYLCPVSIMYLCRIPAVYIITLKDGSGKNTINFTELEQYFSQLSFDTKINTIIKG